MMIDEFEKKKFYVKQMPRHLFVTKLLRHYKLEYTTIIFCLPSYAFLYAVRQHRYNFPKVAPHFFNTVELSVKPVREQTPRTSKFPSSLLPHGIVLVNAVEETRDGGPYIYSLM